jgi:hypothetical protein
MYLVKHYRDKSPIEGRGIFAGEFIPLGTIVFYYSSFDRYLCKEEFQLLPADQRIELCKYGVEDEAGNWVVTNGDANHSCDAGILSLFADGLYCDIAVKDLQIGEEITIDYGLLYSSFPWSMECRCQSPHCRGTVGSGMPVDARTQELWQERISRAAGRIFDVEQALFSRDDKSAMELTAAIKSKGDPRVFPYIKFSLITANPAGAFSSPPSSSPPGTPG